jgi:hypothetical protein
MRGYYPIREEQWFQDELKSALFAACCGSSNIHGKLVKLLFEHGAPLDSMDNLSNDELTELHGGDVLDLLRLKPTLMHIAAQFGSGAVYHQYMLLHVTTTYYHPLLFSSVSHDQSCVFFL